MQQMHCVQKHLKLAPDDRILYDLTRDKNDAWFNADVV